MWCSRCTLFTSTVSSAHVCHSTNVPTHMRWLMCPKKKKECRRMFTTCIPSSLSLSSHSFLFFFVSTFVWLVSLFSRPLLLNGFSRLSFSLSVFPPLCQSTCTLQLVTVRTCLQHLSHFHQRSRVGSRSGAKQTSS